MSKELRPINEILSQMRKNLPVPGKTVDPEPEAFDCAQCRDAGFLHPRYPSGAIDYTRIITCDCQLFRIEQRLKGHLLESCELPKGTEELTFECFTIRPGTQEAFEAALELAQGRLNSLRWLILIAPWDRGKTHLAIAACHTWLERSEPALYAYVPDLLRDLRRGFDRDDFDERFNRYCEVPLLVLDDLGVENDTKWVQEILDSIIDHRYVRRLPLIITTNLAANQLAPRIKSRIQRAPFCKVITIKAGEYRLYRGKDE